MTTKMPADDPAQADRVWFGYHPRTMAPLVAAVAVASLVVWTGRWYLSDLSDLAKRFGPLAVFALAWGVWPALAAVFLYRAVAFTYRLTDRAVLVDYGFWYRPVPPVVLTEVAGVRAGAGPLGRALGVGWVEVRTAGRSVRLNGVRRPEVVAEQIRAAVAACQSASSK